MRYRSFFEAAPPLLRACRGARKDATSDIVRWCATLQGLEDERRNVGDRARVRKVCFDRLNGRRRDQSYCWWQSAICDFSRATVSMQSECHATNANGVLVWTSLARCVDGCSARSTVVLLASGPHRSAARAGRGEDCLTCSIRYPGTRLHRDEMLGNALMSYTNTCIQSLNFVRTVCKFDSNTSSYCRHLGLPTQQRLVRCRTINVNNL